MQQGPSAFGQFKKIRSSEQEFLEKLYKEFDKLSKIAPLVLGRIVQVYDLIYLDAINRKFISTYLPMMRDSPNESKNPIYQYYIFDGTWKGWLPEEQFNFDEERERTMRALLAKKRNSMADVEDLMNWPALTRDSDGWLAPEALPLNLVGEKYSRVEGIRFNVETGEISFLLDGSDDPMESLFDMDDVADIMKNGVMGAWFTLEQPDPNLPNHPFQDMRYAPKSLTRANYLATLLHADLLLKMLSMGTEISGKAPFALRDADESLLERLPEDLHKKFTDLREKAPITAGKVHRFWIEAGDLPYFESRSESKKELTFTFGECEMSVKKHLMVRDPEGKLIDTEKDEETDSPEAKFAKLMTDEYNNLGKYFPELARLRELAKIQAMSQLAQSIFNNIQSQEIKTPLYQTFKNAGIATQPEESSLEHRCTWVPAAFRENDRYKIYGGVNMNANLIRGGNGGNSSGGNGGGGGSGGTGGNGGFRGGNPFQKFQHVVEMNKYGIVYAKSNLVDKLTGVKTTLLKLQTCVNDQWNKDLRKVPDIKALWQSYVGYPTTEHYTYHTNDAFHVHGTNGFAKCTNRDGKKATYKSGDKSHDCSKNKED